MAEKPNPTPIGNPPLGGRGGMDFESQPGRSRPKQHPLAGGPRAGVLLRNPILGA
jgi:hypothetical protein